MVPMACGVFCQGYGTLHGLVQDVFIFLDLLIGKNYLWISVPARALATVCRDHFIYVEQLDIDVISSPGITGLPRLLALFLFCLHSELCVAGIVSHIPCLSRDNNPGRSLQAFLQCKITHLYLMLR